MAEDNVVKWPDRGARRGGRARERLARADRRCRIAERNLAGATQAEIAAEMGVSPATVSMDIAAIKAVWRSEAQDDIAEAHARELAVLQMDERSIREYMDSLEDDAHLDRIRYHLLILRIMERRARLLGLDAPTRNETKLAGSSATTIECVNDRRQGPFQRAVESDPEAKRLVHDLAVQIYGPQGLRAQEAAGGNGSASSWLRAATEQPSAIQPAAPLLFTPDPRVSFTVRPAGEQTGNGPTPKP